MKMLKLLVLTTALVTAAAGCSRKAEEGSTAASGSGSAAGSGDATAPKPPGPPAPTPLPPRDPNADFVSVFATHTPGKPIDPVEIRINKFTVTKAAFDPKVVEGGTASLALDLTSLQSDQPKRDKHISSPDYLDVGQFATVTIDIDNVKKKDGATYTADANVKFHGVEKKFPITFDVLSTTDDSIRIKAEQAFVRDDFKIGVASDDPKVQGVAEPLTIKLQLTLKKT
jgi:polyisoprenoid-binding protein YceI